MPLCCSSWVLGGIDGRRCAEALQAVSSWAVPSLYLPKTALAALAGLQVFALSQCSHCFAFFSSAYLPKTAFAILANLQSEDLTLQEAFPRRKNFSFTETCASEALTNPMPSQLNR
jgi:hypothetical protein